MLTPFVLVAVAGLPTPALSPDADAPVAIAEVRPADQVRADLKNQVAPWEARAASSAFVFGGDLPEGDNPADIAFTPDGSAIVIAHRESRNLVLWDAATLAFLGEVPLSGYPQAFDITPDGARAIVAILENDSVDIVDLASLAVTRTVPVGPNPGGVSVMPSGDLVAISVTGTSQVAVLDLSTDAIVRIIDGVGYTQSFGANFETSAVNLQYSRFVPLDDDRVVNADRFADRVQFIDVRTGTVNNVAVDDSPAGLSVSGDGSTVAVTHPSATRRLTILDSAGESVTKAIVTPVDLFGTGVVLNNDGSRAFVTVLNATRFVNITTDAFGPALSTASINRLVRNFDGSRAFGVGFRGPVFDFTTGAIIGFANEAVSTDIGVASPVADIAAGCSTTFGDDLIVAEIDATPALRDVQLSGPIPEGDRGRTIAISNDGDTAALVNILSDTVSVIDTATNTVTGWAPVGQRPSGVAITPDGTRAVVANLDSAFASVVDLATATTTNINISRRAAQVDISPDGRYAYLPVVADGDGVWRIDLTTDAVAGPKILTGNMGGSGYNFSQSSDIQLNADGSLLAVCGSFDDVASLIDTTTWTDLGDVAVGDFPTYAAFSPDGSTLAVSNKNEDSVSFIDLTLSPPAEFFRSPAGDQPGRLAYADDGRLFVTAFGIDAVQVFNPSGALAGAITVPDTISGFHIDNDAGTLAVAFGTTSTTVGGTVGFAQSQSGTLRVVDLDTLAFVEDIDLGKGPSDLAVSADGSTAAVAAIIGDGAVIVALVEGCSPADLAEPFGVLSFADITAFLGAFNSADPVADLAAPLGSFTFADIAAFLAAFTAGCP